MGSDQGYINQETIDEAQKNIKKVYEEYKDIAKGKEFDADKFEYSHVGAVHFKKLWQAIKDDLGIT